MAATSGQSPAGGTPTDQQLELAFLPLHKRALGVAAAFASAVLVFALTLVHMLRTDDPYPLTLLSQYLYGYSISLEGALIGAFWAGVAGFVAGWFFAFCRNFALGVSTFIVRTRAELSQTRDFLDHI
jgi:ABC-type dipeptide/oligopeptide/nickel transport system permease subunit